MAGDLARRLEDARAEVARLERAVMVATCIEAGHDWRLVGGKNCGCHPDACCSVLVYSCSRCGDCDYGDNEEADEYIRACLKRSEILADAAEAASTPSQQSEVRS